MIIALYTRRIFVLCSLYCNISTRVLSWIAATQATRKKDDFIIIFFLLFSS